MKWFKDKAGQIWTKAKRGAKWVLVGSVAVVAAAGLTLLPADEVAPVPIADPVVAPVLAWNSVSEKLRTGETQTQIHIGWINYLSADGSWQEIDANFKRGANGFEMTAAPFEAYAPARSTGVFSMVNDNRFDVFKKTEITNAPVNETIRALGVADVAGRLETSDLTGNGTSTYVVYPGAYPSLNADLIYYVWEGTAPRLMKLVRFNSNPGIATSSVDLAFELSYDADMRFVRENGVGWGETGKLVQRGRKTKVHMRPDESTARGIGIKVPEVWDSAPGKAQKREAITYTLESVSQFRQYILTKTVSASFFADATYPVFTDTTSTFFPDPDVESTSVDGVIYKGDNTNWTTTRDATSGQEARPSTSNDTYPATGKDGTAYLIGRDWYLFDTSALPDTDVVSAATIGIYYIDPATNGDDDGDDYVVIVTSSPATDTNLITGDFDQIGSVAQSDTKDFGVISSAAYTTYTLNATGISNVSLTGISKFGAREGHDMNDNAYSAGNNTFNYHNHYYAEQTGTSNDPILTVTHAAGAAAATFVPPGYSQTLE